MSFPELKIQIIRSGQHQYQVANALGWSPAKLSNIITGVTQPSFPDMKQLSEHLKIPIRELFAEPKKSQGKTFIREACDVA